MFGRIKKTNGNKNILKNNKNMHNSLMKITLNKIKLDKKADRFQKQHNNFIKDL